MGKKGNSSVIFTTIKGYLIEDLLTFRLLSVAKQHKRLLKHTKSQVGWLLATKFI